ncbi:MAG: carboxylate-amine ligase [Jatrophihabitans sp.]|uniref:carboxylate-amine ligase n=1 Tax=Jatrophihabitans sp. TaxID=1932789 RepID=UPI003F81A040
MSRTVGVEEEFLLVHRRRPRLVPDGDAVTARAQATDPDGQYEHELVRPQAEIGSAPTGSTDALRDDLHRLRGALVAAARERDARLVACGVSPVPGEATITDDERYQRMMRRFARLGREQLTCGMHVHVSIDSREEGIAVIDGLAPHLAVLRALTGNSPVHAGADTGHASWRTVLWGRWPSAGPTPAFGDPAGYDAVVEGLIATGAALDDGMLYFDARLSASYPTVEVRVGDVVAEVDDAVVVAALVRALVEHVARTGPPRAVRPEFLQAASWRAARFGMTDDLVDLTGDRPRLVPAWELVDRLVATVADALDAAGDADVVRDGLAALRLRGTGAQRQRAAFDAAGGGAAGVEAVLDVVTVA